MREIHAETIINEVEKLCTQANCFLGDDIISALEQACQTETSALGRDILKKSIENAYIGKTEVVPVCQDTGMAVFFVEVGQDVHISGSLENAINEGVRRGYTNGYLRKSVVGDPLKRNNTGDNTPAVIHYTIVAGDTLKITFAPKGFGSENMSRLKMLKPADDVQGVIDFVVETVKLAGANPCPPIVVGVGIGGTFEKCACLAKKALTRRIDVPNPNPYYAQLEETLLQKINALNIGPQGFGGVTTALAVNIETFATHIAGLPVAVNINCYVARHKEIIL